MIFLEMAMFEMVSKYLWSGMNVCIAHGTNVFCRYPRSYQRQWLLGGRINRFS